MHLLSLLSFNSPLYEHKKTVPRICLNPHLNYGWGWRRETDLSPPVNILLTFPRRYFFCGSFALFRCMSRVFMLSHLFIAALWSPAGKGLTSWFLFLAFNCVFVSSPCDILGQVWTLDCIDS